MAYSPVYSRHHHRHVVGLINHCLILHLSSMVDVFAICLHVLLQGPVEAVAKASRQLLCKVQSLNMKVKALCVVGCMSYRRLSISLMCVLPYIHQIEHQGKHRSSGSGLFGCTSSQQPPQNGCPATSAPSLIPCQAFGLQPPCSSLPLQDHIYREEPAAGLGLQVGAFASALLGRLSPVLTELRLPEGMGAWHCACSLRTTHCKCFMWLMWSLRR